MLKIYVKSKENYFVGDLYIDDFFYCNCIINREKNGIFPYQFNHTYVLNTLKNSIHITDPNNSLFSKRGFCIHVGNSVKDSKGCVLLGLFPTTINGNILNDSYLYMSTTFLSNLRKKFENFDLEYLVFLEYYNLKGGVLNE